MTAFVTGISPSTQSIDIEDEFSFYGEVINCYIPKTKRICFVKFRDEKDAKRAIERMDGEVIDGAKIRVEWAKETLSRSRTRSRSR